MLIVVGAVAALLGAGLLVGGIALLALTGGDGYLASGSESLRTPAYALVFESLADYSDRRGRGAVGTVRVAASPLQGRPVFLGVGSAAEVHRYLAGVAHDEVRDIRFSPFRYETVRSDGVRRPGPPADQPLWAARASGAGEQRLEFDLRDRSAYRIVVMNADASPAVDVRASFGLRVPFVRRLGTGLTVGGTLVALVGVLLLVWGIRTRLPPRPGSYGQPPAYDPYGYGSPPPLGPPPGHPPAPGEPPRGGGEG